MKNTLIIIAFLLVVGGIYYSVLGNKGKTNTNDVNNSQLPTVPVSNNTPNPTTNATPAPTVAPVVAPVPATANIVIKNFAFNPSPLSVKMGTTVTWVNEDSAPHTVTSDSGNLLNSPTLSTGQSFSFTFNNVGTISYHCNIHKTMKGTIVVTN